LLVALGSIGVGFAIIGLSIMDPVEDVKVEFRDYVLTPHVTYKDGRLDLKLEKTKLDIASWECDFEPYVRIEDGKVVDIGAKCKKLKTIVINPEFARRIRERFGEDGLKLIIKHEEIEGKCNEGKAIPQSKCHYEALRKECAEAKLDKDKCIAIRKWLAEKYGEQDDSEYVKKILEGGL